MIKDTGRVSDGLTALTGGMVSGRSPALLKPTQCSYASNISFRGGFAKTRPAFKRLDLVTGEAAVGDVTVDASADKMTLAGHSLVTGDIVLLKSGTAPAGLTLGTLYYVSVSSDDFFFHTTLAYATAGTNKIDITTAGSGFSVYRDSAALFKAARFQGAQWFVEDRDEGYIIAVAGGNVYRIRPPETGGAGWRVEDVTSGSPLRDSPERVWMVQAKENSQKNYLIIQDGMSTPFIYDPINGNRYSDTTNDEVPSGTGPMAYGHGRLWVAKGSNFLAGDIANGITGVLKFTENEYISGGGSFRVPVGAGDITAMKFTHAPNSALGDGQLIVFTQDGATNVTVPMDRYDWFSQTDPAQRVLLINNGAMSQFSTELANGDLLFRSKDGIRSLIQAVRDFNQYGNTPISREVSRILKDDEPAYFRYTSGTLFDNRYLLTTHSSRDYTKGVGYKGLVVLDFDLISGMGEKSPAAYDGYWQLDVTRTVATVSTEVNIEWMGLVTGMVNSVESCFLFGRQGSVTVGGTVQATGEIELWTLASSNDDKIFDEDLVDDVVVDNKITSVLETPSYNFGVPGGAKRLESADLWVDNVTGGSVSFSMQFHPDQYPVWVTWQDWSVNANYKDCADDDSNVTCIEPTTYLPQYRPRMRVGAPSEDIIEASGLPYNYGFEFAARIKWTGKARLKMLRLNARNVPEEPYADIDSIDSTAKSLVATCEDGELNVPEV